MSSIILHADSNSFYANCERIFRPDLFGKPVIVLSNNDGIIIALTQEAKKIGLHRGDPYFKVKSLCQAAGVAVFSSNYTLYADISRRITSIYLEFAPDIEQYSIDESFLFFPKFSLKEIKDISIELRNRVLKETGMPICVGGAYTKTIAKWYNKHAKPFGGVYIYDETTFDSQLEQTPVEDIWGIGIKKAEKLHHAGIKNGLQLKNMPLDMAKKMLTVTGVATVQELNNIPCIDKICRTQKDVVISSRQFSKRVYDFETLSCALTRYTENAVEKMHLQSCEAGNINVYISTCWSFDKDDNRTIPYANGAAAKFSTRTCYSPEIIKAALTCLKKIFRPGFGYKTMLITLMDLAPANQQLEFFRDNQMDQAKRRLMQNLAELNYKYGRGTLTVSSGLKSTGWEMKRDLLSPCYTTRLTDIPEVW